MTKPIPRSDPTTEDQLEKLLNGDLDGKDFRELVAQMVRDNREGKRGIEALSEDVGRLAALTAENGKRYDRLQNDLRNMPLSQSELRLTIGAATKALEESSLENKRSKAALRRQVTFANIERVVLLIVGITAAVWRTFFPSLPHIAPPEPTHVERNSHDSVFGK